MPRPSACIAVVAVAISVLVACKKTDSSDSKNEPAPEAVPAPPPKAPECAPGAYKNEAKDHAQFCLALPQGFALSPSGVDHARPDVWQYNFVPVEGGVDRSTIVVLALDSAKPGIATTLATYGPGGTRGVQSQVTQLDVIVPNGKRMVTRDENYERDSATESEFVVLSKGEAVGADKERVVMCFSSAPKKAPAGDRLPCLSFLLR